MRTTHLFAHLVPILVIGCATTLPRPLARVFERQSAATSNSAPQPKNQADAAPGLLLPPTALNRKDPNEQGDFILDNVPLSNALGILLERAPIDDWSFLRSIKVDWDDLKAVGVLRETSVAARLRSPTVEEALSSIIGSASKGTKAKLVYFDDGDLVLRISTRERHLSRDGYLREFGMRRFLAESPDREKDDDEPSDARELTRRERMVAIANLIRQTIDPESWEHKESCFMHIERDRLIIRQTEENHKAIARLIEQLLEGRGYGDILRMRVRPTSKPATTLPAISIPAR